MLIRLVVSFGSEKETTYMFSAYLPFVIAINNFSAYEQNPLMSR